MNFILNSFVLAKCPTTASIIETFSMFMIINSCYLEFHWAAELYLTNTKHELSYPFSQLCTCVATIRIMCLIMSTH